MKFPLEEREAFLTLLRERPDEHVMFPSEAYRRDDGRILVYIDGLAEMLHRWAYKQLIGPLPRGVFLLPGGCDWARCQNPRHWVRSHSSLVPSDRPRVRPATGGMSAPEINAAKTHCPQNHEYTPANTYHWTDKKGNAHRKCKRCTIQRAVRQRQEGNE